MKSLMRLLALCSLTVAIVACGPVYKTTYTYQPPADPNGQRCTVQCDQSKASCTHLCRVSYDNCSEKSMKAARKKYNAYVAERRAANQKVDKKLHHFLDDSNCIRTDCDCEEEYRSCFQLCGGKAIPQKTCVASCGK